ncbi:ABATE domain-containing protein [Paenibacillus sp. XY044]|uniref:CGNR zinc finger domain-containing protein n=1 Tax=Paenibacillus sp. XY044 TaxID=2026089 RepID=UPI000B993AF4|nr:ABATE domain-containing protein [Paenibacillus sp. XY044]OZB96044.1 hypothetical protein CJP46_08925 [Paenibacillus sp. XY044]
MLWDDFLNSDWHDWRGSGKSEDRLDRPGWLREWLQEQQLPLLDEPKPHELKQLKELRSLIHGMVTSIVQGISPDGEAVGRLNAVMSAGPVIRELSYREGSLSTRNRPVRWDWQQVMSDIAASFADVLAGGETARIRICENPDCLWVYYDDTRNRSKRYCDDKMCGNLMKVRRFRARKKAAEHDQT